jgi:hypothetical protein
MKILFKFIITKTEPFSKASIMITSIESRLRVPVDSSSISKSINPELLLLSSNNS